MCPDIRVLFAELVQNLGKKKMRGNSTTADVQITDHLVAKQVDFRLGLVDEVVDVTGVPVKDLTSLSRHNGPAETIEKLYTQFFLQSGNMCAYCWLRKIKFLTSF
eukprot:TRINITY_DN109214_c0_g1_i1.p6 TRINITY_DN109214_c0_g1~~TRINITY_DN109214_c0_g1_i1.p6  ORF type:complete len:105 (-),score=14.47 TRINITY_DN109214_c0_g1_i1:217-531(-)